MGFWGPTTRGWNDDGTYTPVWEASGCYNGSTFVSANCQKGVMNEPFYFEDYDFNNDGVLNVTDIVAWGLYAGRNDIKDYVIGGMILLLALPFLAGKLFGKTPSPFEHDGEIKRKK